MTRFSRRSLLAGAGALPILRSGREAMAQTESPITPIEPSETPTDNGTVTVSGRYFGDTGHNLKAPFLRAWQAAGGREGIGAPISEERFQEGVGVTQSFQAVSLVFDPGLEAPWDIQATHISDDVRRAIAPGTARNQVSGATNNGRYFQETGHSLAGKFLKFWNEHGDLPLIGHADDGAVPRRANRRPAASLRARGA